MGEEISGIIGAIAVGTTTLFSCLWQYHQNDKLILKKEDYPREILDKLPNVPKESQRKLSKVGVKKEAASAINEFIDVFKEREVDLSRLYANYEPYIIEEAKSSKKSETYNELTGKIEVSPKKIREDTLRGLLRLATSSSIVEHLNVTSFNGFERRKRTVNKEQNYYIGYGLNKMYSDMLLKRYFGIDYPKEHQKLLDLVRLVEMITGESLMEKMFFRSDISGIELALHSRGITDIDVMHLVCSLDSLYTLYYGPHGSLRKNIANGLYRDLFVHLAKQVYLRVWLIEKEFPKDEAQIENILIELDEIIKRNTKAGKSKENGILLQDVNLLKAEKTIVLRPIIEKTSEN